MIVLQWCHNIIDFFFIIYHTYTFRILVTFICKRLFVLEQEHSSNYMLPKSRDLLYNCQEPYNHFVSRSMIPEAVFRESPAKNPQETERFWPQPAGKCQAFETRNPVGVSGCWYWQAPVGSGRNWRNPLTGSVHGNLHSIFRWFPVPSFRIRSVFFDLGWRKYD